MKNENNGQKVQMNKLRFNGKLNDTNLDKYKNQQWNIIQCLTANCIVCIYMVQLLLIKGVIETGSNWEVFDPL